MKILDENVKKEDLPISFMTSFVSEGWDKVGVLKEQKEMLGKFYKNTKKCENLLQDLIDAYLICIGQMELYLQNNDYIQIDDITDEKEVKPVKESIEPKTNKISEDTISLLDSMKDMQIDELPITLNESFNTNNEVSTVSQEDNNNAFAGAFDIFCDF